MDFARNLPFFSIMLLMLAAIIQPILNSRASRSVTLAAMAAGATFSAWLTIYTYGTGESFTYMMGHFPAPFGNELRASVLEAMMALALCVTGFLSLWGNDESIRADIPERKINMYYVMMNLLMASLLAIVYTNDVFTAFVFLEINAIAACAIVMSKPGGKTAAATVRYLIMSLLGSGMFLLAISLVYDFTGHLLMPDMKLSIDALISSGDYSLPLAVIIGLFCVSTAIKSALFPFHVWLPDAHGGATTASSAILSGLVLKGYIILLLKLFYRVFSLELIDALRITDVIFVLGLLGMIMGSVQAIREKNIKRMIAYSSVSQIGYIFMGIGIASVPGMVAACFHIIAHMATKPMLFIAAGGLINTTEHHSTDFQQLRGTAWRDPIAGIAFVCGSMSMIGIPLFSGFISKFGFAAAAFGNPVFLLPTLIVLTLSTVLNALYFLPAIACIYSHHGEGADIHSSADAHHLEMESLSFVKTPVAYKVTLVLFILLNFILGIYSQPVLNAIELGLEVFG